MPNGVMRTAVQPLLLSVETSCYFHFLQSNNLSKYTLHSLFINFLPFREKVEISNYIDAIHKILNRRERTKNSSSKSTSKQIANIYLATEDPEAVTEFRKALPKGWNLYVDQFLIDTSEHRNGEYNGNPKMAKALNGNAGLLALGSLLVAMEANDFVLTTKSNWSQLMDELRRTILDPRCGNCTSLIDLRQNER